MELTMTQRGFELIRFDDANGHTCSLQQSSAIDDSERGMDSPGSSFLWFGPDDPDPKIMASRAAQHGIDTEETTGWVPYPVPEEVCMTTRMHLHRDQVPGLIDILKRWHETGRLEINPCFTT